MLEDGILFSIFMLIIQIARASQNACQWVESGVCEPSSSLLYEMSLQYVCTNWQQAIQQDCENSNVSTPLLTEGALLSCLQQDSEAYRMLQCVTLDSYNCEQSSQYCVQSSSQESTVLCTLSGRTRTEWMSEEVVKQSVDSKMDQMEDCESFVEQYLKCQGVSGDEEECGLEEGCEWFADAFIIANVKGECLPRKVPVDLLPYRYAHENTVSSMSKCEGYTNEQQCQEELVNPEIQPKYDFLNTITPQKETKGGVGTASFVAIGVAVGSFVAMGVGIWFVVYVHKNMLKYQEVMRKMGIDPNDISLTDFSPLLENEHSGDSTSSQDKKEEADPLC
eukprot:TRINITY_DN4758_c0_g3_i1.p1 TRINITY_DN4758_c0_g3~~TRINITY_DN4758_c0_g3_i1.p1  ORF type:complete len:387 (+),score=52.29 TRINITY_DN4758_c0_g3_i1:159-1163(+)